MTLAPYFTLKTKAAIKLYFLSLGWKCYSDLEIRSLRFAFFLVYILRLVPKASLAQFLLFIWAALFVMLICARLNLINMDHKFIYFLCYLPRWDLNPVQCLAEDEVKRWGVKKKCWKIKETSKASSILLFRLIYSFANQAVTERALY